MLKQRFQTRCSNNTVEKNSNKQNSDKEWTDIGQSAVLSAINSDVLIDQMVYVAHKLQMNKTTENGAGFPKVSYSKIKRRPMDLSEKVFQIYFNSKESLLLRFDDLQEMMERVMKVINTSQKCVDDRNDELAYTKLNSENEIQGCKGWNTKAANASDVSEKYQQISVKLKKLEQVEQQNSQYDVESEKKVDNLTKELKSFSTCNEFFIQNVRKQILEACATTLDLVDQNLVIEHLKRGPNMKELIEIVKNFFEMIKKRKQDLQTKKIRLIDCKKMKDDETKDGENLAKLWLNCQQLEQGHKLEQQTLQKLESEIAGVVNRLTEEEGNPNFSSLEDQFRQTDTFLEEQSKVKQSLQSDEEEKNRLKQIEEKEWNQHLNTLKEKMTVLNPKKQDLKLKISDEHSRINSLEQNCGQENEGDQQMWQVLKMTTTILEMKIRNLKDSERIEKKLDQRVHNCKQLLQKIDHETEKIQQDDDTKNEWRQQLNQESDKLQSFAEELSGVSLSSVPCKQKLQEDRLFLKQFLYNDAMLEENSKDILLDRVDRLSTLL